MLFYYIFQISLIATIFANEETSLYRDISYEQMDIMIKGLRNTFNKTNYLFAHYYSDIKTAKELYQIDESTDVSLIYHIPNL